MSFLLTIAGHDPAHGAGITADLATWADMGLDGASVVTALTLQNSHGLQAVEPVPLATLQASLQAVLMDGEPTAIKIGLLGSAGAAREVAEFLQARRAPVVLDPVLSGSNGRAAWKADAASATDDFVAALRALMQHVDVITPNWPEAQRLLDGESPDLERLAALCRGAVVLKGGHVETLADSSDWVIQGPRRARLFCPRLPVGAHGSGCTFSAALAGRLSQGVDLFDAAVEAKLRVHSGMAQARQRPGRPHMAASGLQLDSSHLPGLQWQQAGAAGADPADVGRAGFAHLAAPLGFYPVVPDAAWVERLLAWGVRSVQLRVKRTDRSEAGLREEVARAIEAGRRFAGAQVFINDHWQLALELGAYGVHLGQEDLDTAELGHLRDQGLRLGISSHLPSEMARAHALRPSYLAIGPVYPTTLKAMRYDPVGLQRLRRWSAWCRPALPVVAIGGISLQRAAGVLATGVDSIAVVSAITQAACAQQAVAHWQAVMAASAGAGPASAAEEGKQTWEADLNAPASAGPSAAGSGVPTTGAGTPAKPGGP